MFEDYLTPPLKILAMLTMNVLFKSIVNFLKV